MQASALHNRSSSLLINMILPGSLPAGAFIAAVLVLVPLPAHWRARNVATVSLIVWFFMTNMIYFVNSLVWSDNSVPRLRVWCDIGESVDSVGA